MKILMINYEFPPLGGGGGVAMEKIATELAKRHKVDVLTSRYRNLKGIEIIDGFTVYRVPVIMRKDLATATMPSMLSFVPASVCKGIQLCNTHRYDIINTHFVVPTGPSGYVLSKLFGIPNVLSIHGGDIFDPSKRLSPHKSRILRKSIRGMMNNASAVVAQSNNTRSNAERYYSPDRTIQIIPLGFEQPSFTMVARETLGMEKNTFYLISIGRLIKRKGYEYLIAALKDTDRDSKLLLIGDGPLEHDLKGLARELDVQSRVLFLGAVSEEKKFQYLSCADSYVLSSLHEGYGIVLQEAMFCGLPIISTDNGGQTDFLSEGANALLVPIEDSKALSRAIQKLKHDVSMREGMRHNNKLAIENVSIEKIAAAYEALFEKAAV